MWIIPTMSRPQQCAEVLARISEIGCSTKGIVFINGLSHAEQYKEQLTLPEGWKAIICDTNLGALNALNKVFEMFPDEPFYGFIADDEFLMPDSPSDWDKRLIQMAGNWNAAHGWEDLHNGKRLQGYVCWGGDLVRAVGYLTLPTCWHWFGLDSMWEWLAGSKYFGGGDAYKIFLEPEVKVEHRHAYWKKSPMDECYELGGSLAEEDRKRFVDWQRGDMLPAAERIKKARGPL